MFTYLIPCKDNHSLLLSALMSIDFDNPLITQILVVDDHSELPLQSNINFEHHKLRIVINASEAGIVGALNYGVSLIQTKYILRLDSDDIDFADRVSITAKAIEIYPDADIISFAKQDFPTINQTNISWKDDKQLKTLLTFGNPIYHPSTCLRSNIFDNLCYSNFILESGRSVTGVEDYFLWCRSYLLGLNIYNHPEIVIKYRKWEGQVSNNKAVNDPAVFVPRRFQSQSNTNTFIALFMLISLTLSTRNSQYYSSSLEFLFSAIKRRYGSARFCSKFVWVLIYFFLKVFFR